MTEPKVCPTCGQPVPGEDTIGNRIKTALILHGHSVTHLASRITYRDVSISASTLRSRLDGPDTDWKIGEVCAVADFYGIRPEYLAFGTRSDGRVADHPDSAEPDSD